MSDRMELGWMDWLSKVVGSLRAPSVLIRPWLVNLATWNIRQSQVYLLLQRSNRYMNEVKCAKDVCQCRIHTKSLSTWRASKYIAKQSNALHFSSLSLRSLLWGHSWESFESRGGQLLKTLSQGCGLLADWDMTLKSLTLQSSSSVIIATAPLRQVDVQVTLQLALDNLILLALPSFRFLCSPTSTSWSWHDVQESPSL